MAHPSKGAREALAGIAALCAGCAIAIVDTRPSWDDTGVTAGALLLAAGLSAFAGLRWWLAALLVAGPLLAAELRGLGWGAVLVLAIALAGAGLGAFARSRFSPQPGPTPAVRPPRRRP